MRENSIIEERS